ncbi:MAG: hypothetical protein Q9169_005462 [Polycauliona sp. 2 TL-2023]
MDVRGYPPMTRGRDSTMPQAQDFSPLALQFQTIPRPALASNHSNSLPSTPYQHARKLNFNSRSPSPVKRSGDASPRSAHSESEKTQVRGPFVAGCKFETGMAHSRRRIPYSVGGEQLDRPSSMPKKYLNPAEEDKLSGDMRELYDRILPSKDSDERRTRFVEKLERILNEKWPGNNIGVHVFGSSGNMLCTHESDVDICITTSLKSLERVCHLAAALAEHGMERVVCVNHAKVPIVKIWDPELQLACDMNVNNTLAIENTRMIKTYVEIDERVRPLAMIIKYWTRKRILNDAALGGTLSSYTWICMILNFLQTRNPPVLPCLHKRPHQRLLGADGKPSAFADDLSTLRGWGKKNKETLGELLFHFFRRYAYELDYEKNVVSVREGTLISKEAKRWHLMQNNRLCVEEPFNIERNLGNTADDISFRGLHLEIRRAFGLISEAKLSECTEQYEYPAVEERIWEKPAPKPPPILSRSHSQSGRGGKSANANRGGRNGQPQNRTPQGRRASSAATTGRLNGFPYGQRSSNPREHPLQAHYDQLQLHERFLSEYQLLQAQEQELRIIQAQTQLHAHAHNQAHAHGQSHSPMLQLANMENTNRQSAVNAPPLSAPIRNVPFYHPSAYPSIHGDTGQSVHTNPSSPSMRPTQLAQPDLRRRIDRSSAAEAASSTSRSHSQPARPLPMSVPMQNLQAYPMGVAAFQQYQQARQQQLFNALELAQRNQRFMENHNPGAHIQDYAYEESLPKEYVGYYVHDSPSSHAYRDMPRMSQIPVYHDLQYFRPPRPDFSRLRRNAPRSPSPSSSTPYRDRSQSVRSAASAPPAPVLLDRTQLSTSSLRMGPIIADGSDDWDLNDYIASAWSPSMSRTATKNGMNATEDQRQQLAMPNDSDSFLRHVRSGPELEPVHRPVNGYGVHEPPRVPDAFRNLRAEQAMRSLAPQTNGIRAPEGTLKNRIDPHYSTSGLGMQHEGQIMKPKVVSNGDGMTHGISRQSLQSQPPDKKADYAGRPAENSLEPPPILSPVREVRSPSPTVTMKNQVGIAERVGPVKPSGPWNLDIPPFSPERHEKRKQKEALLQKPNGIVKSSPGIFLENQPLGSSSPGKQQGPQPHTNGWQQQTKKGKKKPKGHASTASTDTTGEPIPLNEAERKGG